ncbi:MAG TPA: NAD-dependent epimerase/dehydratase family protein [Daejeonella sp.]|nr:NAD-dependent epimerase/dehydratase family protein [Daejeonella sp.]
MILVTGATGFLGSELVRQLLQQGKSVRALKRESSVIPAILSEHTSIDWREGDVLDYYALAEAMEGITEVYHCAAMVSFRKEDKKKLLKVNVEGTAHLVNLCLQNNVRKLVHVSSVTTIGQNKNGDPGCEDDHWQFDKGQSNYSISKYESEMEVFRGIAEGLKAVIVNPSIIIGKNAGNEGSGQLFETVRKGLKFYPGGSCGLVDVEDVARMMIQLMDSDIQSERFIINAENMTYRDLFTSIATGYGLTPPGIKLSPWIMRTGFLASSIAKAVTGKEYGITKEILNSAFKTPKYSNKKIREALNVQFKPISESILEVCNGNYKPETL